MAFANSSVTSAFFLKRKVGRGGNAHDQIKQITQQQDARDADGCVFGLVKQQHGHAGRRSGGCPKPTSVARER
jgi:hypothetical protein